MALLQALFALLSRSSGRLLNAIFGWAVRALFGQTTPKEQTVLSALVAAAVAWPLLVTGIIAPRVTAFVLALVPPPKSVPANAIRLVWLGLALLVPFVVGLVVASKAPPGLPRESFVKRLLRGFPITLGLAAAVLIMFVTVPILRVVSAIRRRTDVSIPLATNGAAYHQVADLIEQRLNERGFALAPAKPGWWVSAPIKVLQLLGGQAFRGYIPADLRHFEGPGLQISFYPTGLLLRGLPQKVSGRTGAHRRDCRSQRRLADHGPACAKN